MSLFTFRPFCYYHIAHSIVQARLVEIDVLFIGQRMGAKNRWTIRILYMSLPKFTKSGVQEYDTSLMSDICIINHERV